MGTKAEAGRPSVVVVTPVYNEADCLGDYREAVGVLLSSKEFDFRVLFVDDGSSDGSWRIIREFCAADERFEGLRLSRNYGSHVALSAGFRKAGGDAVVTLACDLQDPPEVILEFLEKWRAGAKIVWGRRRQRTEGFFRVWASNVFASLLRRFAMPRGSKFTTGSFLLADRKVVNCFREFQEHNRITFALMAWTGFDQEVVDYDRVERTSGTSKWSMFMIAKTFYDAFIGFSQVPVKFITGIGLVVFLFSLVLSLYLVISWFFENPLPGWTSTVLAISVFSGIQLLLMGLIGEYLYRIYSEVTRRPLYFISEETDSNDGDRPQSS